ncbi:Uncharacterised protein [Mycobacteroides abscessus subsp. abscessus]|nr:Uncharacterised protein [Mycobacteroides abscessus subsp. abscessus]
MAELTPDRFQLFQQHESIMDMGLCQGSRNEQLPAEFCKKAVCKGGFFLPYFKSSNDNGNKLFL